jgi:hypothetical protein
MLTPMDTEQRKDVPDELYVLGYIAGLCQQEPRDQLLLDDMLMYLRAAQEAGQQNRTDCYRGIISA